MTITLSLPIEPTPTSTRGGKEGQVFHDHSQKGLPDYHGFPQMRKENKKTILICPACGEKLE